MSRSPQVGRSLALCALLTGLACGGEPGREATSTATTAQRLVSNATTPGTVVTYNTVSSIAVEWPFSGDDNANGVVTFRSRKAGTTTWKQAMPLRRIPAGSLTESSGTVSWGLRHTGSLFDLDAGSTYELELTLTDPDGGSTVRTVSVTTRAIPAPMANAPVKSATPSTLATVMAGAQPGDIIQLGAGTYTFPGNEFTWTKSGTASAPIELQGMPGAVFAAQLKLTNASYVHVVQLLVQGRIRIDGSSHVAIRRCRIESSAAFGGDGIFSDSYSDNSYIADNTLVGVTTWQESSMSTSGTNLGEGIRVTGPGHVIRNNRVTGYRDGISLIEGVTYGQNQYNIDILSNDLVGNADDGIEADYCLHNCRIQRNRLTNNFVGISAQPTLGGPNYMLRNVLYNVVHVPFKLYKGSSGDVLIHNTVVKQGDALAVYDAGPVWNLYTRNNIFIGGPGGTFNGFSNGTGKAMDLRALDVSSADMDYDGFGSTTGTFTGKFGPSITFSSITQCRSATTEAHAVQVDLSVFASTVAYPSSPMTLYAAPDLRIGSGSAAAGAGENVPGVSDGFTGTAPSLGAYEPGATLPTYGPRYSGPS